MLAAVRTAELAARSLRSGQAARGQGTEQMGRSRPGGSRHRGGRARPGPAARRLPVAGGIVPHFFGGGGGVPAASPRGLRDRDVNNKVRTGHI